MSRNAVVLLSGGMDSAVVLAMARAQGFRCHALSVRYGQRHTSELEAAARVARELGAVEHKVVDVDLRSIGGSALTADIDVPTSEEAAADPIPVTYVPARNTIMLSVALGWAEALIARDTPEDGRRAQALLRPMATGAAESLAFQRTFARASEVAGDPVRAGEAWAEAALLGGRAEQALVQLNTLKRREDLDYYARERIEARIARITPLVLELHRQGIRDEVLDRR